MSPFDLRHRPFELYRLEPAPQPNDVPGMQGTGGPGPGLTGLHGYESGAHQAGQHPLRGDEGVLRAHAFMRRWREHGRGTFPDRLKGKTAIECTGMRGKGQAYVGVHDRNSEMILGGIARPGSITARAAVKDQRPPQAAGASSPSSLTASTG